MSPLERLFRLEIEFHRRLRTSDADPAHAPEVHTSYALQSGYEQLIRDAGTVAAADIDGLRQRSRRWRGYPGMCSPPPTRSSGSWGFA